MYYGTFAYIYNGKIIFKTMFKTLECERYTHQFSLKMSYHFNKHKIEI